MLEGVEVVVRALLEAPGEGELGDGLKERTLDERGLERLAEGQGSTAGDGPFCGLCSGWDDP